MNFISKIDFCFDLKKRLLIKNKIFNLLRDDSKHVTFIKIKGD